MQHRFQQKMKKLFVDCKAAQDEIVEEIEAEKTAVQSQGKIKRIAHSPIADFIFRFFVSMFESS